MGETDLKKKTVIGKLPGRDIKHPAIYPSLHMGLHGYIHSPKGQREKEREAVFFSFSSFFFSHN